MHVEMEDDLPAGCARVDHKTVPGFDTVQLGHFLRRQDHFGQNPGILLVEGIHGFDVLFGDDEKMNRRMRIDVLENGEIIVLINDVCLPGMRGNIAEDAAHASLRKKDGDFFTTSASQMQSLPARKTAMSERLHRWAMSRLR
jgi:hypothetical protein